MKNVPVLCAICGDPAGSVRGVGAGGVPHRRHSKAQLATIRARVDDAAKPLTLAVLMYLIDPAGFRGVTA